METYCGNCGKRTDERQLANVGALLVCFDCEEKLTGNPFDSEEYLETLEAAR